MLSLIVCSGMISIDVEFDSMFRHDIHIECLFGKHQKCNRDCSFIRDIRFTYYLISSFFNVDAVCAQRVMCHQQ